MNTLTLKIAAAVLVLTSAGCTGTATRTRSLDEFKGNSAVCYDRNKEPFTLAVDAHLHFRPFGGPAVPFAEMNDYFNKTGVRFVNIFGIGQLLPVDSSCTYYLDCPGTPVVPSIKSDFINAANYLEFKSKGMHMTLSMTFPDLSEPEHVVEMIRLYDKEYPQMFKWMGEVNLVKQALFKNQHLPVTTAEIDQWAAFMKVLRDRNIPMTIHADMGNNQEPAKYLPLMEHVLQQYPDNKIIWAHIGLSKELTTMNAAKHIQIMKTLLEKYPHLMFDISWRVLDDAYFSKEAYRDLYVDLFNAYPERFLAGTDFVASRKKDFAVYKEELEINSRIFRYVNDKAFRNIVLGENYFRLLGLKYHAPQICSNR